MSVNDFGSSGRNLPRGWIFIRLGDIAQTTSGGTPRRDKPHYYGGSIPWVKSGELGDRVIYETSESLSDEGLASSNAKIIPKGTLCIALYGATVGKLGILGIDAATNQAVCAIFPPANLETRYLYRFFEGKRRELIEQGKGGAQSNISQGIIRDTMLPVPPVPEQRRIVAEIEKQFTRLDAGVAGLRRVQANLKRYRAAVLKAACEGRLVPTEAELAKVGKRKSKFETGEALLARILTDRRRNWKGSGQYKEPATANRASLPPIPEGWTWARAEQLCGFITKGTTPSAENMRSGEGEIPFIKVYNLTFTGALNWDYKPVFISRKTHEVDLARSEVLAGDILINIVGPPLGQVSIVPAAIQEANINQAVARFRVVLPESRKLLGIWLMAEPIIGWAKQRAKTTAGQSNLTLEHCRDLPIPLPPPAEQTRIVAEVERRLSVIDELVGVVSANLQRSTRLRESILQKAFTGALV